MSQNQEFQVALCFCRTFVISITYGCTYQVFITRCLNSSKIISRNLLFCFVYSNVTFMLNSSDCFDMTLTAEVVVRTLSVVPKDIIITQKSDDIFQVGIVLLTLSFLYPCVNNEQFSSARFMYVCLTYVVWPQISLIYNRWMCEWSNFLFSKLET